MGSMSRRAARSSIALSVENVAIGSITPRVGPVGVVFVYTASISIRTFGQR